MAALSEAGLAQDQKYDPKVRWALPNRLDFITFVGKYVFAIAHDVYIIFYNFKTNNELVYTANNQADGDGVDVIAGHRSNIFVFAEKAKNPRIFVLTYPRFIQLAQLRDMEVNRYKAVCMMDGDLIATFTGFSDYMVTVWNWRTQQRLLALPTGVVRRKQIYMASRTHMLLCECWGEGLIVWEVAQCYKQCLMMRRAKEEVTGWEVSDPPLVGVCWTNDGQLYAIDPNANLYSVLSDGIGMITNLEWSENLKGPDKPCVCSFGNGILIYGPDQKLRSLKKFESEWKAVWNFVPYDSAVLLESNMTGDVAAMGTVSGCLYRLTGEAEDKIEVVLYTYRQRNIIKVQLIAPDYEYIATINKSAELCIYGALTGNLVLKRQIEGGDVSFQASPVDPLLVIFGELGPNYGMGLFIYDPPSSLEKVGSMCLTHQIVSQMVFSPDGRVMMAVAKSAGHIFIFQLSKDYKLTLVRYTELGRGLANCFLMKVGDTMRSFNLVLFSDKYSIGERIICIDAVTGKDNKFAGKMQGPYAELLPLAQRDTALAVPHLTTQIHVLKLAGDKGVTVSVKMGPVFDAGHDLKQCKTFITSGALLTFSCDGTVIMRKPTAPAEYELKLVVSHRYESGAEQAVIDPKNQYIVHLGGNGTVAVTMLNSLQPSATDVSMTNMLPEVTTEPPDSDVFNDPNTIIIFNESDKNYLDLQEDKRVHTEAMDYKSARDEAVRILQQVRAGAVSLLEENLEAPPLHRLHMSEFNLHAENKKERLKQAEKERDEIRFQTEARIRAQDKVTAWIKKTCWDSMGTPRVKIFAIFSHYYVENFAVLPSQRELWPELQLVEALRALEMENDADVFRPWEEHIPTPVPEETCLQETGPESLPSMPSGLRSIESQMAAGEPSASGSAEGQPYALSGTDTHQFVSLPPGMLSQTLSYSFLHMDMLQHLALLNSQNLRLWFNKEFNDLMNLKIREVGLVMDRNARLRFIIEELNKLSDLRGSFHHLTTQIWDPEWRQEEQPLRLIKVDTEECSIPPYVSPSQIFIPPPPPGPPDDFRERALIEMMDGVLEKLWHEEIKKPIPKPQCMLEKEPEHFNEDDLRLVFDYEAKVAFRNEERDKYRKMLHAEYAKLTQVLNEAVVKFNQRVKEMWLLRLKIDSAIGQENLNLMRLRRTNLDRIELAEEIEKMRDDISKYEAEVEKLLEQNKMITEQKEECTATFEAHTQKDRYFEKLFRNHFGELSPIIVDQCYKFVKKRPKWQQRAGISPCVLYELAAAALAGTRPPLLPQEATDYLRALDQLDQISNMPPVMDENLWTLMCKLRRGKIENEMSMRAVVLELGHVESTLSVWERAVQARRAVLARLQERMLDHRQHVELLSRNKTVQLVLPAGQVEIITTGHMEDFDDAALILRKDIELVNEVILKVGDMKLNMMRKQIEYRKGILSKEWEHAQMKMKLRHMEQELYAYQRLKIPKELQLYLKNKEQGYTDEQQHLRMERDMEASRRALDRSLAELLRRYEDLELKHASLSVTVDKLNKMIAMLKLKVSEKRIGEDPLQPIRYRKIIKTRMETLVARGQLIREVQANHSQLVLLQTELELLRLRTYPTLASFRTIP